MDDLDHARLLQMKYHAKCLMWLQRFKFRLQTCPVTAVTLSITHRQCHTRKEPQQPTHTNPPKSRAFMSHQVQCPPPSLWTTWYWCLAQPPQVCREATAVREPVSQPTPNQTASTETPVSSPTRLIGRGTEEKHCPSTYFCHTFSPRCTLL